VVGDLCLFMRRISLLWVLMVLWVRSRFLNILMRVVITGVG